MPNFTYIENSGIGYKTGIKDLAAFLLKDHMDEVFLYPSPQTTKEEININGVILGLCNGRVVDIGTYPLYEKYNKITTPTYVLPNWTGADGNIISKGQLDVDIGSTNQWKPPSHEHTFAKNSFNMILTYTRIDNTYDFEAGSGYFLKLGNDNISFSSININNTTTDNDGEYQPEKTALSPYLIVDYRG
ncbi:MAG: hypothetical protein FWE18_00225 [Alphaproteobacteria bacterium]|nr:hypothetical protein [Alphaproteobacteria bacterium]